VSGTNCIEHKNLYRMVFLNHKICMFTIGQCLMKYLEKYVVHGGGEASRIYIIWDRSYRCISGAYLVHIQSMYSCMEMKKGR
jgi:hypothetical protein